MKTWGLEVEGPLTAASLRPRNAADQNVTSHRGATHLGKPMNRRTSGTIGALLLAGLLGAAELSAQAGTTTATVRGRVIDDAGAPIAGAQVSVRNETTGVQSGALSRNNGLYIVPFIAPGGPYEVTIQMLGFGTQTRRFDRLQIGEVVTVDFELATEAVEVEGVEVAVEATPIIETREPSVIDRVSQIEIEALPTNGRNFADFVVLSPSVIPDAGDGSGGNLSLGGGRRGGNNIQIDGVGNNGTFFGGEARGSDRIAFAFSMEAVKEFQVITNGYDVEHGSFNGGLINTVTRSGTNEFQGSAFFYRRGEELTGDDFLGIAPQDFSSNQFGGVLAGPIVRDKAHFLVSVDRQDRSNPVNALTGGAAFGSIAADSLQRFIDIMQSVYGYDASQEFGQFSQTNDQTAVFARVDWQLNDDHNLTLRNNFTDLQNDNDRVSTNEGVSNGGIFEDRANSFVANLKSILSATVFNDFRFQYATESRPREAFNSLPQLELFQGSTLENGQSAFTDIEIFNDPVLPNSLDENTIQIVNNLVWQKGDHTIKVGTNNNFYDIDNFFFFNGRGEFEFTSLAELEAGIADEYSIATPGQDGSVPRAVYKVNEFAFYAQDEWQVNENLNLTFGLRYDITTFPDEPNTNQTFLSEFGVDNGNFPVDSDNIAPRFGFAYDLDGDGRSVIRGGAGLFYGRYPSVFWSNALLNTGESQGFVQCSGDFFNTPEAQAQVIAILRGERPTFTSCGDIPGGSGFAFTPNINAISNDIEWPGSWKLNLGYDRLVRDDLRVGLDVQYNMENGNFYNADVNLRDTQFTTDGGRPVLAPADEISTSSGEPGFGDNRVSFDFNDALVMQNIADSRTVRASLEVEKRFSDNWSARGSYSWSQSKDHTSHSCCISSTAITETPTAGNPNFLGEIGDEDTGTWGYSDFDRTHTIILSGLWRGPGGVKVSGIYRGMSGFPYTPMINGDINADGRDENDRAYIPSSSGELLWDTPEDQSEFDRLLEENECLQEEQGRIAHRNSCRSPWQNRLDMRIAWEVPTISGQNVELIADVFNVLNLLSSDWGEQLSVFDSRTEVLTLEGFDPGTQRHIYGTNGTFGEARPFAFSPRQWQIQIGARYEFR